MTNSTTIAALLEDVPMGCRDAVLHEPVLQFTQSTLLLTKRLHDRPKGTICAFSGFFLPLHGNQKLEKATSKILTSFLSGMDGISPSRFQGLHSNNTPVVGVRLLPKILRNIQYCRAEHYSRTCSAEWAEIQETVELLRYDNYMSRGLHQRTLPILSFP